MFDMTLEKVDLKFLKTFNAFRPFLVVLFELKHLIFRLDVLLQAYQHGFFYVRFVKKFPK